MKTDDASEEAEEPPEEPLCSECIVKLLEHEEDEGRHQVRRLLPENWSGFSPGYRGVS
jgi:hypothetical protein